MSANILAVAPSSRGSISIDPYLDAARFHGEVVSHVAELRAKRERLERAARGDLASALVIVAAATLATVLLGSLVVPVQVLALLG